MFDATAIDLTEIDALESELRRQREIVELVVRQMPAAYWIMDRDLRFQYSGGAVEQMFGFPATTYIGRTLSDAFVILDEAQNATGMQMKMFLTRLGVNSRAVITGDKTQIDLANREDSGLLQVERILPGIDGIAFCYLDDADVVRHRLVRDIIKAYAEDARG